MEAFADHYAGGRSLVLLNLVLTAQLTCHALQHANLQVVSLRIGVCYIVSATVDVTCCTAVGVHRERAGTATQGVQGARAQCQATLYDHDQ